MLHEFAERGEIAFLMDVSPSVISCTFRTYREMVIVKGISNRA